MSNKDAEEYPIVTVAIAWASLSGLIVQAQEPVSPERFREAVQHVLEHTEEYREARRIARELGVEVALYGGSARDLTFFVREEISRLAREGAADPVAEIKKQQSFRLVRMLRISSSDIDLIATGNEAAIQARLEQQHPSQGEFYRWEVKPIAKLDNPEEWVQGRNTVDKIVLSAEPLPLSDRVRQWREEGLRDAYEGTIRYVRSGRYFESPLYPHQHDELFEALRALRLITGYRDVAPVPETMAALKAVVEGAIQRAGAIQQELGNNIFTTRLRMNLRKVYEQSVDRKATDRWVAALRLDEALSRIGFGDGLEVARFMRSYDPGNIEETYVDMDGTRRSVPVERPKQSVFYHYTGDAPHWNILIGGFKPSASGNAGRGLYLSANTNTSAYKGSYALAVAIDPARTRMVDITQGEGQRIWQAFQRQTGGTDVEEFARRYHYDFILYGAENEWYVLKNAQPLVDTRSHHKLGTYVTSLVRDPWPEKTKKLESLRGLVESFTAMWETGQSDPAGPRMQLALFGYEERLRTFLQETAPVAEQQAFREEAERFLAANDRLKQALTESAHRVLVDVREHLSVLESNADVERFIDHLLSRRKLVAAYSRLPFGIRRGLLVKLSRDHRSERNPGTVDLLRWAAQHDPHHDLRYLGWEGLLTRDPRGTPDLLKETLPYEGEVVVHQYVSQRLSGPVAEAVMAEVVMRSDDRDVLQHYDRVRAMGRVPSLQQAFEARGGREGKELARVNETGDLLRTPAWRRGTASPVAVWSALQSLQPESVRAVRDVLERWHAAGRIGPEVDGDWTHVQALAPLARRVEEKRATLGAAAEEFLTAFRRVQPMLAEEALKTLQTESWSSDFFRDAADSLLGLPEADPIARTYAQLQADARATFLGSIEAMKGREALRRELLGRIVESDPWPKLRIDAWRVLGIDDAIVERVLPFERNPVVQYKLLENAQHFETAASWRAAAELAEAVTDPRVVGLLSSIARGERQGVAPQLSSVVRQALGRRLVGAPAGGDVTFAESEQRADPRETPASVREARGLGPAEGEALEGSVSRVAAGEVALRRWQETRSWVPRLLSVAPRRAELTRALRDRAAALNAQPPDALRGEKVLLNVAELLLFEEALRSIDPADGFLGEFGRLRARVLDALMPPAGIPSTREGELSLSLRMARLLAKEGGSGSRRRFQEWVAEARPALAQAFAGILDRHGAETRVLYDVTEILAELGDPELFRKVYVERSADRRQEMLLYLKYHSNPEEIWRYVGPGTLWDLPAYELAFAQERRTTPRTMVLRILHEETAAHVRRAAQEVVDHRGIQSRSTGPARWLTREAAGSMRFGAAFLAKEAIRSAEERDWGLILEAARGMKEPGFWGSLAVFSGASQAADAALRVRVVPGLARALTRPWVPLAAGMAAMQAMSGGFSGRDLAFSTASFAATGMGVEFVARVWVPRGSMGVVFGVAKLAATLYLAEKLEGRMRRAWDGVRERIEGMAP
ncbi:MAG: hypothetical protein HYY16_03775 [Planctomycetes bacterium]|nr:hypothetical protein [Planctomycetota bacterium]